MYTLAYIKKSLIPTHVSSFKIKGSSFNNFKVVPNGVCSIRFGDGNSQEITTETTLNHTYSANDEYTIEIWGDHKTFQAPINTIEVTMLSDTINTCASMFRDCSELTSFSAKIPRKCTDCSNMFNNCLMLQYIVSVAIPISVSSCKNMFSWCNSLQNLPEDLTILNDGCDCSGMFHRCEILKTIPAKFKIPTRSSSYYAMFRECFYLTDDINKLLPDEFNYDGTIDLSFMFSDSTGITGTAPADKLWNSGKIFKTSGCFYNCASLSNYNSIPFDWMS